MTYAQEILNRDVATWVQNLKRCYKVNYVAKIVECDDNLLGQKVILVRK